MRIIHVESLIRAEVSRVPSIIERTDGLTLPSKLPSKESLGFLDQEFSDPSSPMQDNYRQKAMVQEFDVLACRSVVGIWDDENAPPSRKEVAM
jgi:hypothetical protein